MDRWDSGTAYEAYVGRWSRLAVRELIGWLGVPSGARWLDVGCGTGVLTETILSLAQPASVKGIDLSEAFIAHARAHITDPRASFEVGSAESLPVADSAYDAVVSGLMLNFVPDQAKAAREMHRAASDGGIVGVYVWDYAGHMQMMRVFWDAVVELDPRGNEVDEGTRFPICHPDALSALFRNAGFREVETRAIDIPTRFRDFDDYWIPFTGGTGTAPAYLHSRSADQQQTLRDRVRQMLPIASDGSIDMIARAWAVRALR